jgi:[acyl-carrier-protein] S-malonyltransferase
MQHKLALIFPGQGCQKVGMGADCYQAFAESREVFAHADEALGFSLSKLCFEGPEEQLFDTANTQPAIYTTTYAMWKALEPRLTEMLPQIAVCAGHSLGEFSALAAAGAMSFEDGLRLVRCRGEAMRDAGAQTPGGMTALISLDDSIVAEVVAEINGDQEQVWGANYNSPGQVVIAGERAALERASALATARGANAPCPGGERRLPHAVDGRSVGAVGRRFE